MNKFTLVPTLSLFLANDAPEPLKLAAQDLLADIAKATGHAIQPQFATEPPARDGILVRIRPEAFPNDAVENWRLHSEAENRLFLDGSDMRGTIFGIYAFCAEFLHILPDYLWNQLPPRTLPSFQWPQIERSAGNPDIRYRGVFINDEDLLTKWEIGGPRHTTYKYYHTVITRNTARKIAETLLRMGYNLAIPASFVDIRNPEEEMLLEEFSRRGFLLTMHHVEPLGVSAFGFDNYWAARGQHKAFSYFADPEALREVWRDSIQRWSKYPEVIWQLGLRGRGDRPFWEEGLAPESDEERAALIAHAILEQKQLVLELTHNPNAIFSTTLWGEGSLFNSRGLLHLPPDIITVFADNCAGWRLQDDFYQSPNLPHAAYGVYCHHAIMCGTHLAQAIGARDFHLLFQKALGTRPLCYAIFNAANIREFLYGLAATSQITAHCAEFSAEDFLQYWVRMHFTACQEDICQCYREYFASFVKNDRGVALATDGLLQRRSEQALSRLRENGAPKPTPPPPNAFQKSLADMFPTVGSEEELLRCLSTQEQSMTLVQEHARAILPHLPSEEQPLFYAQMVYPSGLNRSLCRCEKECRLACLDPKATPHLVAAAHALQEVERLLPEYLTGDFQHWYDGCEKVNFRQTARTLAEMIDAD